MLRKEFYIREDQERFLASLPGNQADHIRRALDLYIESFQEKAVTSPSAIITMKGEHING